MAEYVEKSLNNLHVLLFTLFVLTASAVVQVPSQEPDLLNYSITGSSNSNSPAENATYAMADHRVQRLLLDIAKEPRSENYVEQALRGSGISISDMVQNGSLRLNQGRYWLNFSLLTRADQEILRGVVDKYSNSLASALLHRRAEIEKLLATYDVPGVDRQDVAFVLIGCFALDWQGLSLTTKHGYRAEPPKRKGGEFFFMAEEVGGLSPKEIYWGSNSNANGHYGFLTFGDHYSGRIDLNPLVVEGEKIGPMLFALREGRQSTSQLANTAHTEQENAAVLLKRLEEIGWVDRVGTLYESRIPIFTQKDQEMARAVLKICDDVMASWLKENYPKIRKDFAGITPERQHVPYTQAFDQIWHYLFGITNRKLVRAGLLADPYAPGRARPGYVPAVYEVSIAPDW